MNRPDWANVPISILSIKPFEWQPTKFSAKPYDNQIDIKISIPDKVLTGSKYDIDVILNQPLEETIIAGGIQEYQEGKLLNQSIPLEPLATGGIFKVSRAPLAPGIQTWTGIIAHPSGLVSFTKTVNIVNDY